MWSIITENCIKVEEERDDNDNDEDDDDEMMIVKNVVSHSWARFYFVNIYDAEEKKYLGSFPHSDEIFCR